MDTYALTALCPLDGRYADSLTALRDIFSEYALIKTRLRIEIAWLKTLSGHQEIAEIPTFSHKTLVWLDHLVEAFSMEDAKAIKRIENTTCHDVKALEYWIKERLLQNTETQPVIEFVHFACTSEDINNLSYGLMLQQARQVLLSTLDNLVANLTKLAHRFIEQPMISRTHGQAATPTTVGKELANVVYRLNRQRQQWLRQPILGKFNGAVGNYSAQDAAYPTLDWEKVAKNFVERLGIIFNPYTTQIEPHDYIAEYCHTLLRINTIVIDLCRDIWGYLSFGDWGQQKHQNAIGSSTMPHKINPIHFENAEGNAGLANALLAHFAEKLPISRFQRDLSDSTVLRNLGTALAYTLLSYQACQQGLLTLHANSEQLTSVLMEHWELLAEPIQTVMRRYGLNQPYEKLKALTQQPSGITQKTLADFIENLDLPQQEKIKLKKLTPARYLGYASQLAKKALKQSSQ